MVKQECKKYLNFAFGMLIVGALSIAVILGTSIAINALTGSKETNCGINKISVYEDDSCQSFLSIEFGDRVSDKTSYSVRMLAENEGHFFGNKLIENDGTLGKYRIEIMFYGIDASEELSKKYPIGKIHRLEDFSTDRLSDFKIRIAYPPDDTMFVVYIGSDQPISIKEQGRVSIDENKSSIQLTIDNVG